MPGKTARALCPVCQEPMPPDETECENCGAFVIDEAVVRLCRALGIPREKALALFEKGFRHPKQLQDRNVDDVLQKGENGLLFLCTNCGGFVATGDPKCPRCDAEFEVEPEEQSQEKDILDITLCPVCGADNEANWKECEICGEPLGGTEDLPGTATAGPPPATSPAPTPSPSVAPATAVAESPTLERIDNILEDLERPRTVEPEAKVRRVAKRARVPKSLRRAPATPSAAEPAAHPQGAPRDQPGSPQPIATGKPVVRPIRRFPRVPRPRTEAARATAPSPVRRLGSREAPPRRTGAPLPSELEGGLTVAAISSLYLSDLLGQPEIAWGVTFVVTILVAYVFAGFVLRKHDPLRRTDALALLAGAVLSAAAPGLHQTLAPVLSVAGMVALAFATRQLLTSQLRDLIVAASGIPVVAFGVLAGLGFAFAGSPAWTFGLLAAVPWPAAVAVEGLGVRRAALAAGEELSKAESHLEKREYAASVKDFDRAIARGKGAPGEEMPWYGKGASLVMLGRYEEALRAIDKALDLNPRNEVAWLNKGNALTKMGRLLDALRCFNAAIKVNPGYEVAWNNKGNTLARLGHLEEALACYDRALEIDPGYRGAWVNKGYVLTKLGRYDEATSCADRALRLNERARTGAA